MHFGCVIREIRLRKISVLPVSLLIFLNILKMWQCFLVVASDIFFFVYVCAFPVIFLLWARGKGAVPKRGKTMQTSHQTPNNNIPLIKIHSAHSCLWAALIYDKSCGKELYSLREYFITHIVIFGSSDLLQNIISLQKYVMFLTHWEYVLDGLVLNM